MKLLQSIITFMLALVLTSTLANGQNIKYVHCGGGAGVSAFSEVVNDHGRGEEFKLVCGQRVEVVREYDTFWTVIQFDKTHTAFVVNYFLSDKNKDEKDEKDKKDETNQQQKFGNHTIEVINSQAGVREFAWSIPGRPGYSRTDCSTTGTANGTATSIGNTTFGDATGNSNTSCQTTYTPPTEPTTTYSYINQVWVYAVVDSRHMKLWCQKQFRDCRILEAGNYEAESKGDAIYVMAWDPGGKRHRIKYRVVGTW
jgi:hypothetical protein